jgi:Uma2 family endonuclease
MTADDYLALPDEGRRYELLDGSLEEMTSPGLKHQRVIGRLYVALVRSLQDPGLGEVLLSPFDVVLDERTVLQPDLLFIRSENAGILNPRNARGAPDVVIEVLSESTRRKDVVRKARLYARAGVPWYWLVDLEVDRVEFLRRVGDGYELVVRADAPTAVEPPGFDELRLDLAALFA